MVRQRLTVTDAKTLTGMLWLAILYVVQVMDI
jgi:hypothetical protein